MSLPAFNLDANTTHLIAVAFLSWLGYELRQWRLWYMANHGGIPNDTTK